MFDTDEFKKIKRKYNYLKECLLIILLLFIYIFIIYLLYII